MSGRSALVVATEVGACADGAACAAALAVACATEGADPGGRGVVFAEASPAPRRRPTLLSSSIVRERERALRDVGFAAAARGRLCWVGLPEGDDANESLPGVAAVCGSGTTIVAHLPAHEWRSVLDSPNVPVDGALIRADLARDRLLVGLAVDDLQRRRIGVRVVTSPLGVVGARRALAGLDPGGAPRRRLARFARALAPNAGQSLPLVLGAALAVIVFALALVAIGSAVTATARGQRGVDLAALSAARSMRDDLPRLVAPEFRADGTPNPDHLGKEEYLARAEAAGLEAATRNDLAARLVRVEFPDRASPVPVRARVELVPPGDSPRERPLVAEAEAAPPPGTGAAPAVAGGGGYGGPLAYRQGKPMRPDVAAAFDRLAAAARADGIALVISRRTAPTPSRRACSPPTPTRAGSRRPGTSLHRCGTELDLGPAGAYAWLASNAGRFGFVKRYAWEPWHFGFDARPRAVLAAAAVPARPRRRREARRGARRSCRRRYRDPIIRAAARWDVSAGLLSAQLLAESDFDPRAVSPAGARGIAQFMPATAAAYGLRDPFDPAAAIDAQAHLMSRPAGQFGSVPLALAAYNAGPAPVAACDCVPPYPETQAYVARILALMGGAGEWAAPLEVRLVA